MKRMLFLINPHAGKTEIRGKVLDVVDLFVKSGWEVVVRPTQKPLEIPQILREEAEFYQLVTCCGGDGTLNETVSGLLASQRCPKLGYIPAGTVNDFASSLGISKNILQAARTAVSGTPFSCDIGSFNDRCFTYIAAFGAFTEVSYQTPQQSKNLLGRAAYILEGIKRLPNITSYHLTIEQDGERYEDDFIFGMVTNTTSVGGFKAGERLGIKMNDGLLETVWIRNPRSMVQAQQLINDVLRREFDSDSILTFRTAQLRVHSDAPLPWTLDGEFGGDVTDAEIRVLPRAVEVMADLPQERQEDNTQ